MCFFNNTPTLPLPLVSIPHGWDGVRVTDMSVRVDFVGQKRRLVSWDLGSDVDHDSFMVLYVVDV